MLDNLSDTECLALWDWFIDSLFDDEPENENHSPIDVERMVTVRVDLPTGSVP